MGQSTWGDQGVTQPVEMSKALLVVSVALCAAFAAAAGSGTYTFYTDNGCKTAAKDTTWTPVCSGITCTTVVKALETAGLGKGVKCPQKACPVQPHQLEEWN